MLVALGVLLALAALLAIPVDVAFRLEAVRAFAGRLSVRWIFGAVRLRLRIPGGRPPPGATSTGTPAPPRTAPQRRGARRASPARLLAALRQPALRSRVRRLAGDLVRAAHFRRLRLWIRLGLGDPADTGRAWGLVGPLAALAGGVRGADVRIEPEFHDAVLELRARGRMRLVPLQLAFLALGFLLSPASVAAWRTLVGRRG